MSRVVDLEQWKTQAPGKGLEAKFRKAGNLFQAGGLPVIDPEITGAYFKSMLSNGLIAALERSEISKMDFFCGLCSAANFCRIFDNPQDWRERNFLQEYRRAPDSRIFVDIADTALLFYSFVPDLPNLLMHELGDIGTYFFWRYHFATGKIFASHLYRNFAGIAEILQRLFRVYYQSYFTSLLEDKSHE